jgi:hypothetical protein
MPEIIHCPRCRRKLQAPESTLGQDVQCPDCGATFRATLAAVQPAPERPPPPRPRAEPREAPRGEERPPVARPAGRAGPLMPHRGGAVLTLGVLALVGVVVCVPSVILGPVAWVMGRGDLALIRAGRMDRAGEAATANGLTCGVIATALGAVGLVLTCAHLLGEGGLLSFGAQRW